jgi:hypothetical protein
LIKKKIVKEAMMWIASCRSILLFCLVNIILVNGLVSRHQSPFSSPFVNGLVSRHQFSLSSPFKSSGIQPLFSSKTDSDIKPLWTVENLEDYCDKTGVVVSFTTMGPGYRAVARAKHDETMVLGYVEGFLRPGGAILHLDKMEVFKPVVKKAKQQRPELFDFGGVSFGIGLVMGYRCLLHGQENGCRVAEFLAIDDEEFQHKRLVRYYRRVGFQVIKYVGEDFMDIPDRLIWGGCGTLMREDLDVLIRKWADLLALMKERASV